MMSSSSKSSAFKMFSVHTKMQSQRFRFCFEKLRFRDGGYCFVFLLQKLKLSLFSRNSSHQSALNRILKQGVMIMIAFKLLIRVWNQKKSGGEHVPWWGHILQSLSSSVVIMDGPEDTTFSKHCQYLIVQFYTVVVSKSVQ